MPTPDRLHAALPDTLLAFDTSTERMAVGVDTPVQRWHDNQPGGPAASAALLPAVDTLLRRAGRGLHDLVAVAFGRGPGAFTGLRTSCAVAQGLAFGLGRPVLPIDSLLIVAEQARRPHDAVPDFEIGVVMDARMGEVYAARYRWQQGRWQVLQAPALWAPDALAADWAPQPPAWTAGSAWPLFEAALRPLCAPGQHIEVGDDRATALLALAAQAWADGGGLDCAQALPLYLRDKVAQTTDERAAAKAAAALPVA